MLPNLASTRFLGRPFGTAVLEAEGTVGSDEIKAWALEPNAAKNSTGMQQWKSTAVFLGM